MGLTRVVAGASLKTGTIPAMHRGIATHEAVGELIAPAGSRKRFRGTAATQRSTAHDPARDETITDPNDIGESDDGRGKDRWRQHVLGQRRIA